MKICKNCKHRIFDDEWYRCKKEYCIDVVTGIEYIIGNCEHRNRFGNCPDYEEKISIWERITGRIKMKELLYLTPEETKRGLNAMEYQELGEDDE